MTPTELEDYIRRSHNTVGDNFFSSAEILNYVYDACLQMAREAYVIERLYSTTTVAGTQSYAYPTNTIAIKRITYDGRKLQPISLREDDQLTGLNQATTSRGTPQYYFVWNESIYLRPIPDSALTLNIYSFNEPQTISTSSTLEIPTQFHVDVVDYVLSRMSAKEQNFAGAQYWRQQWESRLMKIKQWSRKRLRADSFTAVNDVDSMNESFLGII